MSERWRIRNEGEFGMDIEGPETAQWVEVVPASERDHLYAALVEIRNGAPGRMHEFTADDDAIVPMNIARLALEELPDAA